MAEDILKAEAESPSPFLLGKPHKVQNPALVIAARELSSYFSSPLAYIIIAVNMILLSATVFKGLFLGYNFFLYKSVDLRLMFLFQSVLLTLFIPILTMKLYADERRTLTIETLFTLPVTHFQVALGKTLAAFVMSLVVIAPTIFIPGLVGVCGTLDTNQIIAGYVGLVLLSLLFCTIGVAASAISRHQNIALFISLPLTAVLMSIYVPFTIPKSVPHVVDAFAKFLSCFEHFTAITHGVLDLRDVLYFISLTVLFFAFTTQSSKKEL